MMAFGPDMTDDELEEALRERGCPEHLCQAGKDGLVERWTDFVAEVEEGYALGLEDYRNELDLRTILADFALDQLTAVQQADVQLRELLVPTSEPLWGDAGEDAFWLTGYPSNAAGELLEGLRDEGLLSHAEEV